LSSILVKLLESGGGSQLFLSLSLLFQSSSVDGFELGPLPFEISGFLPLCFGQSLGSNTGFIFGPSLSSSSGRLYFMSILGQGSFPSGFLPGKSLVFLSSLNSSKVCDGGLFFFIDIGVIIRLEA
jgi:hypothetical protein